MLLILILEKILSGLDYEVISNKNLSCDIKNLTIDSRQVVNGSMFFCIKGLNVDGHNFINDAIEHGAKAIVLENNFKDLNVNADIVIVKVKNTRQAVAFCSANFFGYRDSDMNLIGVTGTNGKTSTTYLIKKILAEYGRSVGLIGTIDAKENDKHINIFYATSTTPDPIELHKILKYMREKKISDVVIEVSSHALSLHKVDALKFKIGVFTNLTQDHLDFHGNMENYLDAKRKLFDLCEIGILNKDDSAVNYIVKNSRCKFMFYGIKSDCDFKAENIVCTTSFISFDVKINNKLESFYVGIPGEFNVYNSLGAIAATSCFGVPVEIIKSALKKMTSVPGRMQKIESDKFNIIIDYAHSPDSLKNVLLAIRKFCKRKLILVFGCGGDRDKTKREVMGKIASELADYCMITSDNPRTEEPMEIINEIEKGIKLGADKNFKYEKICDRREAIKRAIEIYCEGDVVLIAGKGHENYQIFADRTVHFDDVETAKEIIDSLGKNK